jgi:hypothetical protein
MSKQLRGFKAYEKDICDILNFESFDKLSKDDMDGCFGVAMVMSYIWDGVNPTLFELSNWLNVSSAILEKSYDRLRINGVFSSNYNARKDQSLLNVVKKVNKETKSQDETDFVFTWPHVTASRAYGMVHGISAGYCGLR